MNIRSYLEHTPQIGERVLIDPTAVVIGRVALGDDVSIWPMSVVRGDVNFIRIGVRTNVQDACVLHVTHDGQHTPGGVPLIVGADVTIGHKVVLHACTVGDRCLIGMGAIVMDGVTIEDEVLVAAGSLVSPGRRLAARTMYRGSPVRKVRELRDDELQLLRYSAAHYVRLKNHYLESAG